jgi:hypothetical protein
VRALQIDRFRRRSQSESLMAEVLHHRGHAAVQPVPNSLAQTSFMFVPMNNPLERIERI